MIAGLRDLGKTIFLTTHYMDEAEYLADRIAVIASGRIVAEGTPTTLGGRDRMTAADPLHPPGRASAPTTCRRAAPARRERGGRMARPCVRSESPLVHVQMLADWALGRGFDLADLDVRRPTLEDVYLALTDPTPRRNRRATPMHQRRPPRLGRMALHQFRYDLRAFVRNRQPQFFTLALPVLFLVIFASVFGGNGHTVAGRRRPHRRPRSSYVPGIIALGIIAAAFINLVISVTAQRETGVLKRRRATPVPAGAIIAGEPSPPSSPRSASPPCCSASAGPRTAPTSRPAPPPRSPSPSWSARFRSAASATPLASVIHDQDAAQPVTQAVMLPLYFISGVFVAASTLPHWLVDDREPVSRPTPRRRAAHRLQPPHPRRRLRRHRPAHRRRLGCGRPARRPPPLQLAPPRPLTRSIRLSQAKGEHDGYRSGDSNRTMLNPRDRRRNQATS